MISCILSGKRNPKKSGFFCEVKMHKNMKINIQIFLWGYFLMESKFVKRTSFHIGHPLASLGLHHCVHWYSTAVGPLVVRAPPPTYVAVWSTSTAVVVSAPFSPLFLVIEARSCGASFLLFTYGQLSLWSACPPTLYTAHTKTHIFHNTDKARSKKSLIPSSQQESQDPIC